MWFNLLVTPFIGTLGASAPGISCSGGSAADGGGRDDGLVGVQPGRHPGAQYEHREEVPPQDDDGHDAAAAVIVEAVVEAADLDPTVAGATVAGDLDPTVAAAIVAADLDM